MASIVTQSDQNGPKWVQNGPKWVQSVQNGSKMGPKRVPKGVKGGSQGGSQNGSPIGRNQKKSRKIFVLWLQSTKKVTDVPVFEEKKIFLRKKIEKKKTLALQGGSHTGETAGGCSPQGGLQGGCRARKKKVPEKISNFFFGPNRVINPLVHDFEKVFFFISQKKIEKKNRPTRGV